MTKQERNQKFVEALSEVMEHNDGKFLFAISKGSDGKYDVLMDFSNDPSDINGAIIEIGKTMLEMAKRKRK